MYTLGQKTVKSTIKIFNYYKLFIAFNWQHIKYKIDKLNSGYHFKDSKELIIKL